MPDGRGKNRPRSVARSTYGVDRISFRAGFTRDRSGHTIPDLVPGDGSGQTIAIVVAGDNPYLASNLHAFDQACRLPDGVLTKVAQDGGHGSRFAHRAAPDLAD
jgi:hypothetical protein